MKSKEALRVRKIERLLENAKGTSYEKAMAKGFAYMLGEKTLDVFAELVADEKAGRSLKI